MLQTTTRGTSLLSKFRHLGAFGLFFLADRVLHLGRLEIQTMMYLMLSVAGHLTIFLTRTRGPFWSIKPARILLLAVVGTQTLATCIALFGLFMARLDWRWVLLVWVYAIVWALVSDRAKLVAYAILDKLKDKAKSPPDLTPLIAVRAFEFYKGEGSHDGHAVEDWTRAEQEIKKEEVHK